MYYYQRPDIDKMYLYVKDPFELKYQLLINGREKVGIKKLVLDYWQTIDDVYENLEHKIQQRKGKCL